MWTSLLATLLVLTFDDLPIPDTPLFTAEERSSVMVEVLRDHQVKACYFVIGDQIRGSAPLDLLSEAGHLLANHTASHPHLSALDTGEGLSDIFRCHDKIQSYPTFRPYFRYPYLDFGTLPSLGGSVEKGIALTETLAKRGYRHGYVTINTFDWAIQSFLTSALEEGKCVDFDKLGDLYIELLKEWARFYREQLPLIDVHVLLLHANDLNTLYLDRILSEFADEGWEWTDPEKAFETAMFSEFAKRLRDPTPTPKPPSLNVDYLREAFHAVFVP